MLFNSYVFVLAFLPLTLAGFFLFGRLHSSRPARLWLLAASLVFYGWWSWGYLALLVGTMVFNWGLSRAIRDARSGGDAAPRARRLLAFGIGANLTLLGYFKYATFVVGNAAALTGLDFAMDAVVLPLAISFHTFQQIAYLVDVRRGRAKDYDLADYLLFVSFFPQLIAGPIVHHYELLPQIERRETYRFQNAAFAEGVAFFVVGLVKKLVIADPVGALATPVFHTAAAAPPGLVEAWLAVSAYSVGLYFDFSAYSDMAIGLARMFGIRFPYNFNSPYKAASISDFWRRWHMTLSRFLRDYLYIPLGGNRRGPVRRSANLMLTMLLGGLWHGAGWTFVVWGALHGLYLLVNHAWSDFAARTRVLGRPLTLPALPARALTLLAVMVAWVFFAAPSFGSAAAVLAGMAGANGAARPETAAVLDLLVRLDLVGLRQQFGGAVLLAQGTALATLAAAVLVIFAAPNSQQIVDGRAERPDEAPHWHGLRFRPTAAAGIAAAAAFLLAFSLMADVREFVYFQF
jgi:D-alanyl-lipoteichoic acid acyltransferase DltB (MBOAT superfamily)